MKKKNGFIAISLIYSFFLCFIMIMMYLLANYSHSRLILNQINAPLTLTSKTKLSEIVKSSKSSQIDSIIDTTCNNAACTSAVAGTSYYYTGNVTNNYVKFAGKMWRIIRVNGDGTVRMILYSNNGSTTLTSAGVSQYNYNSGYATNYEEYFGYTYKNSSKCTKNSLCTSTSGRPSSIKTFLTTWYSSNLNNSAYNSKIAETIFCNDTTISETNTSYNYYSASSRMSGGTYSLECPDPDENYGGVYKLKIGLITIDEHKLSVKSSSTFLNYGYSNSWTMTPYRKYNSSNANYLYTAYAYYSSFANMTASYNVYPVINLKADTTISGGDGTSTNPYIVE